MKESQRFTDSDIRQALRHKYDQLPVPPVSEDFMAQVMKRMLDNSVKTTRHLHHIKVASCGIAASVVVALATWMYVETKHISSDETLPRVCLTEVPAHVHEPIPDAMTMNGTRESRLALPTRPTAASSARHHKTTAGAVCKQTHTKPRTMAREKSVTRVKTVASATPQRQDIVLSSHPSAAEGYTQETMDMLCARFDMGRQQIGDLRAGLAIER